MSRTEIDLLVIGAGPAGLYAAYYAGFRRYSVTLVDSLPELGGQVSALYPEKVIYDVAGFVAIKGQDLVDALVDQAATANPQYMLGHRAEELVVDAEAVTVTTHLGAVVRAKVVLITGGIGTFTPRPMPDADGFAGRGLRYFVKRLDDLSDQRVLIVGGGDSAFDWAASLEPIAKSVTLIHRRSAFRAHQATVDAVLSSRVEVLTPYELARIHGSERVDSVEIFDNLTGERRTLPVDTVVAALGFTADLGPFTRWGLDQRKRHILVDSAMRTNLRRVFAAGDIVDYDGKVKLISVAFGEAATAVNNAAGLIEPGAKVFPGHSTGAESP
jgi:thioredoxin reductase